MFCYIGNRKIKTSISIFVAVLALIGLMTSASGSAEQIVEQDKQKLPQKFSIAAPEIRPLIYLNESGQVVGQFVDMFAQFSKTSDIDVQLHVMPWGRALQQVKSGKSDALMPALYTDERATFLHYPEKPLVVFAGSVVLQHREDTRVIKAWSDIVDSKIVKVRSMHLGVNVQALFEDNKNELIEVIRINDGMQMLQHKRVDFVVMDSLIALTLLEQMQLTDVLKIIPNPAERRLSESFLAFSKQFSAQYDVNELMTLINQINDPDKYIKQIQEYMH